MKIEQNEKDIISGKTKYKRFNEREQAGLKAGGQHLIEASLIVGGNDNTSQTDTGSKLESSSKHTKEIWENDR